jgi:serine/threonine-protein kinase RsbW
MTADGEPPGATGMDGESRSACEFDSEKLVVRLDVTVAADKRAIGPVVDSIMKIIVERNCAAGMEFEIETAVREAVANAVIHGAKEDPAKTVQVWVGCDESRGVIIGVRDPGPGFDPSKVPAPVEGERLYSDHGRGIYLINQLMDDVRFERGGSEIWMRKK